jgi:MoxR-like ATPase
MLELQDISLLPKADCRDFFPLHRVSLRLAPHERCVAVFGSHKNTAQDFLTAIAGKGPAYTGNILWKGTEIASGFTRHPHLVQLVDLARHPDSEGPVKAHLEAHKQEVEADDIFQKRLAAILEQVQLTDAVTRNLNELSRLENARAAIAGALLCQPELLLCENISAFCNNSEDALLLHLLKAVSGRGVTVLYAVDTLADLTTPDAVIVFHEGHLAFHAAPEHLLHYFDIDEPTQLGGQLHRRSGEEWARSWAKHRGTFYRMRAHDVPHEHAAKSSTQNTLTAKHALPEDDAARVEFLMQMYHTLRAEVGKVIVGQHEVIEQLLIAVLAGGHCLLEGVPGLAKTAVVRGLSQAMQLTFRRIQFTPDLMPADVTGTDILQEDPATGRRSLVFQKGPIFTQMLLADEINRTPAKTQAALLEAMQEHSVTAGGHTVRLEQPFFVLATQNPIEQEGTYPLPEAQKDRFLFHIRVGYPDRESERLVIERTTGEYTAEVHPVINGEQIIECQKTARRVPVPAHVMDFVLTLVRNTRPDDAESPAFVRELISWGAGPRACQCLVAAAKVRAILQGRLHVSVEDIEALALPVLRHRIVPTFQAESEGFTPDKIILRLLQHLPRLPAGKPL